MKEQLTTFKCDCTGCESTTKIKSNTEYPYKEGWVYLFKLDGKIQTPKYPATYINQICAGDKHFCSMKCLLKFVKQLYERKI